MESPYSDKVMELFQNPKNVGEMEEPDARAKEGSPACGDMVVLYLKVDEETKEITDIKFKSYGCASNIATGSIITEMAKGKTLEEAKEITWEDAAEELGGLPSIKKHCSVLAADALHEAIRDYEERHGLAKDRGPTTDEVVNDRLQHVMNPRSGVSIVADDLVEKITVEDGTIDVRLGVTEDDQFASALEEDIREKLEALWDIEEVNIHFE